MRIAVYSTGGNGATSKYAPEYDFFPKRSFIWDDIAEKNNEHTFMLYVALPGGHIIDAARGKVLHEPKKVLYTILDDSMSVEDIADRIAEDEPDIAIACSLPDVPYDWNPIRDALVADILSQKGIKVISSNVKTAVDTFFKNNMSVWLSEHGFNCAKGVYIKGNMYSAADNDPGIERNTYREYRLHEVKKLTFPVIIKPTSAAGSVGLSVVEDYDNAVKIIDLSAKSVDLIVEEKLEGESFGIEIYGIPGNYHISDPICFSTGDEGITDPFSSIKFGPVLDDHYNVPELKNDMKRLAEELCICGSAQVDLIYCNGKWSVIEVNPRYSLMSEIVCAIEDRYSLSHIPVLCGNENDINGLKTEKYAVDFKSMLISEEEVEDIRKSIPELVSVMRFRLQTSKESEVGYCEYVVASERKENVINAIERISALKKDLINPDIMESIKKMI